MAPLTVARRSGYPRREHRPQVAGRARRLVWKFEADVSAVPSTAASDHGVVVAVPVASVVPSGYSVNEP